MRVIALKDGITEIFNDVDKIEAKDPSWIEIDEMGDINADIFILFRDP